MKPNALTRAVLVAAALLAGCSVGPDYVRPAVETPVAYKEAGNLKQAEPRDDDRGRWWEVYDAPMLDQLQDQVGISNQNLAKAEAQYRQALALVQSARAGYYPSVTGGVSITRSRASATTGTQASATPVPRGGVTNYDMPFQASWAPDVWGNISRAVEANEASVEASAGDLEAARLAAQAALRINVQQQSQIGGQRVGGKRVHCANGVQRQAVAVSLISQR